MPINVFATTESTTEYYTTSFPDAWLDVSEDPESVPQSERVNFTMSSVGLIKGIRYVYTDAVQHLPHTINHRFEGDTEFVEYNDTEVPSVADPNGAWHTFRIPGPAYLIDDDPLIYFFGTQNNSQCIRLAFDGDTHGHSYSSNGDPWVLMVTEEAIVQLLYETIPFLPPAVSPNGLITATDYVDAYNVTLEAYTTYNFKLERISGTGNLRMRLVLFEDLTNNNQSISEGTTFPKSMSYTPTSSDNYILLIEAVTTGIDTASYKISYTTGSQSTTNNLVEYAIAFGIGAVIGVVITAVLMRRKHLTKS